MKKEDPVGVYVMGGLQIVYLMDMLFDIIKTMYQHIFKKILKDYVIQLQVRYGQMSIKSWKRYQ
jgi:hypothetical protein